MMIYCVWKKRIIIDPEEEKKHNPNHEWDEDEMEHYEKKCITYVEAWMTYEIRIFLFWITACGLFLVYGSVFRF